MIDPSTYMKMVEFNKFDLRETVDLVNIAEHHFFSFPGKAKYCMHTEIKFGIFKQLNSFHKLSVTAAPVDLV